MTPGPTHRLWETYLTTLTSLAGTHPGLLVFATREADAPPLPSGFVSALGERLHLLDSPHPEPALQAAAALASSERPVFVNARSSLVARSYGTVRQSLAYPRSNVKLVARFAWPAVASADGLAPVVEDVGLMRGIPGMAVVVPADPPTTRSAVEVLAHLPGPAYVRLAEGDHPTLSELPFTLGRANVVRDGTDLTLVAAGPILGAAIGLAEELHRVGVSARVLDLASVKPIDAPALLRAARDTGGVLVVEEHSVETGLGELVAAIVSENFPVPVRRVAVPDLFEVPPGPHGSLGPAADRMRDEAWELLRLRGKVQ